MASWSAEAAVAAPPRTRTRTSREAPQAKPRARTRRRPRSHGAILWIAVTAILLGGVVFVNLAVLRLNLAVDHATQERAQLRADNATLQSELSAALASPRIQAQARRQYGLEPAQSTGYVNLAP